MGALALQTPYPLWKSTKTAYPPSTGEFRDPPDLCKPRGWCVLPPSHRQTRTESPPTPSLRAVMVCHAGPGSCFSSSPAPIAFCLKPQGLSQQRLAWYFQKELFPEHKQTPALSRSAYAGLGHWRSSKPLPGGGGLWGGGGCVLGTPQLWALQVPLYRSGN